MNVSIFERVDLVNEPRDIDIDVALSRIRVPKDGIRAIVEQVMMAPDKDTRGRLKKRLPVVTFGGTFEKRAVGGLKHGSGLMIIDLDDVDATKAKEKMSKDKHVYAAWISPSGTGLKYLVRIPIVTDD